MILQTVANVQMYDVCECSCLQWICTGVFSWSYKHFQKLSFKIDYIDVKVVAQFLNFCQ